jgi:hypothetical protein
VSIEGSWFKVQDRGVRLPSGLEIVEDLQEHFPDEVADEWLEQMLSGCGVTVEQWKAMPAVTLPPDHPHALAWRAVGTDIRVKSVRAFNLALRAGRLRPTLHAELRRPTQTPPRTRATTAEKRPRQARRTNRRRATRAGSDDSDSHPELPVRVVGEINGAALYRAVERHLEGQYPGTSWRVVPT